jgi:uncharacterized protein (TIGR03437 family)
MWRFILIIILLLTTAIWAQGQIGSIVVTSAAGFEPGLPAKGSIAAVFVTGLTGIEGIITAGLPLPTELAGVRIRVGGTYAPIFDVAAVDGFQQINFQVPLEAKFDGSGQSGEVSVEQNGRQAVVNVPVRSSPGDFFRTPDNRGVFQHAGNYSTVTPENPAQAGEYLIAYLTGMPGTQPIVATGQPAPSDPPAVVPQVRDNGRFDFYELRLFISVNTAHVITPSFIGLSAGLVGVYQINFQLPSDLATSGADVRIDLMRTVCTQVPFSGCPGPGRGTSYFSSSPVPIAVEQDSTSP